MFCDFEKSVEHAWAASKPTKTFETDFGTESKGSDARATEPKKEKKKREGRRTR